MISILEDWVMVIQSFGVNVLLIKLKKFSILSLQKTVKSIVTTPNTIDSSVKSHISEQDKLCYLIVNMEREEYNLCSEGHKGVFPPLIL